MKKKLLLLSLFLLMGCSNTPTSSLPSSSSKTSSSSESIDNSSSISSNLDSSSSASSLSSESSASSSDSLSSSSSLNTDTIAQEYKINSFNELPSNWVLNDQCDVSYNNASVVNDELVIANSNSNNPGESKYFGSVYYIDSGYSYTDFTFEMNFKMTSWVNDTRWMGIAYHTNVKGSNMTGYLMNYRCNGNSAYSAINSARNFNDGTVVNKGISLNDNNYHTIKIVMKGTQVTHYMDNTVITSWNISDRTSHLGGDLTSGGFAVIVNQSTISIKNVSIEGTRLKAKVSDDKLVETYKNTSLTNFPTVICDIKTKTKLEELSNTPRPSNAILHINENMNVVDSSDEVIDSFSNVCDNYLKKQVIPVAYIKTENEADALIKYLSEDRQILDMAVMSSNATLVKKVKETHSYIRGIVKYETETDLSTIVKTTNMNYANVAVISQELATVENVAYIQARFKTVWVEPTSETTMNLYSSINSGAYGIIVNNFSNLYSLYGRYSTNSLSRTPFNVAHRGLPSKYNENSVSGVEAAIEAGATHLELDCYLTTDGEVVIMHDSTIDRTSNGTGNIESYTLSKLKEFDLDLVSPYDKIPTLEEVVAPIKESNKILVLEIKSSNTGIVDVIRTKLEALGMMNNTVVISFNLDILAKMKTSLPEIPTSNLNTVSDTTLASSLYTMGQYNTGVDTMYSNISTKEANMTMLRDRGIVGWFWTYGDGTAIASGISNGYVGLTNNAADFFNGKIQFIKGSEYTLSSGETINNISLKLTATCYDGSTKAVNGKIVKYMDMFDYYLVVCSYQETYGSATVTLYTQPIKVNK